MTTLRAVFAGPGARRALAGGRTGAVEIVLPQAAYVRLEQDWVLLAEASVPFGPLSLSVPGLADVGLEPALPARVADSRLHVGQVTVSLERARERRLATLPSQACPDERVIATAAAAADAELAAVPESLADGISALAGGRLSAAVAWLAGRGPGLTPAGDDVLAGYAASRFILDRRQTPRRRSAGLSLHASGRSSPLGLAYLRCAERGELPEQAARLLGAICSGSIDDVRLSTAQLRRWGGSSGTAIGWGITAAFGQWLARRARVGSASGEKVEVPMGGVRK